MYVYIYIHNSTFCREIWVSGFRAHMSIYITMHIMGKCGFRVLGFRV